MIPNIVVNPGSRLTSKQSFSFRDRQKNIF